MVKTHQQPRFVAGKEALRLIVRPRILAVHSIYTQVVDTTQLLPWTSEKSPVYWSFLAEIFLAKVAQKILVFTAFLNFILEDSM